MADKGPVWDRIVAKHGLDPYPYEQIVSWQFADATLGVEWDVIRSTLKARRYGFDACIETDRMFGELYAELGRRQIIPATVTSPFGTRPIVSKTRRARRHGPPLTETLSRNQQRTQRESRSVSRGRRHSPRYRP
jgi:hypothetical protein